MLGDKVGSGPCSRFCSGASNEDKKVFLSSLGTRVGSGTRRVSFRGSLHPESFEVTESLEHTDSLLHTESFEVTESLQHRESFEDTDVGLDLPDFSTELKYN